ncbi:hypothetical protein [Synechococcus sp. UW105]|uniref:hypothetical protein n=1 Tax=Synechococcus sp. UW105 TaxID=337067 RepID=UPI000E0F2A95|nr:hypothetical protein [Synechococcus sp. UW105]
MTSDGFEVISCRAESRDGECIGGSDPTTLITPIKTMTTIKTIAAAAASLAAGATLMTVAGPAAQANPYNTFGRAGGCDSLAIGGGNFNGGGFIAGRDCGDHRDWASREARRNRQHDTQTQLIGLGGGLLGQIINGSQQRQQAAPASGSKKRGTQQQTAQKTPDFKATEIKPRSFGVGLWNALLQLDQNDQYLAKTCLWRG